MSFCPWCGKENVNPTSFCESCGKPLSKTSVAPTPQPGSFGQTPFTGFAGKHSNLSANRPKTANQLPQFKTDGYTFPFIISFLIPFFGFMFGAIMLASDNQKKVKAGKTSVLISLASIIIAAVIITVIILLNF